MSLPACLLPERLPLSEMEHAMGIDKSAIWALRNGRLEALKRKNFPTPDNQQPFKGGDLDKIMDRVLYVAMEDGDVDKFMEELEKVCESRRLALSLIFDQVTPSGNSLLHVAASSGKEDVIELILTHFPCLMTRKNSSDDTPLHIAVRNRRVEATRKLICLRRDLEIMYRKNKVSKSPLYLAVENCKSSKRQNREGAGWEILQLFLQESARDEAYAVKIQGISPVLAALEGRESDILQEIIDRLPKLLHLPDEDGGTPLHSAASVGNVEAVKFLLSKCSYLALRTDKNGSYPIHIACERGNVDIIRELVGTWPNLAEIKNKKGQNILHVAAKAGNNDMVQSILKECCKPVIIKELENSKDVDGNTPCDLAPMHSRCEVERSSSADIRNDLWVPNNDETAPAGDIESRSSPSTHDELPKRASSGESFNKETEARLIVAVLVASVTFTAGITLPGGYNTSSDPNPGMPTLLRNQGFQVFIIFDAFATYISILAVLFLLRARRADLDEKEFHLERAGLMLSLAVIFMTVAFSASSIVAVSKLHWLKIFFLCFGVYLAGIIYVFAVSLGDGFQELKPVFYDSSTIQLLRGSHKFLKKLIRNNF